MKTISKDLIFVDLKSVKRLKSLNCLQFQLFTAVFRFYIGLYGNECVFSSFNIQVLEPDGANDYQVIFIEKIDYCLCVKT